MLLQNANRGLTFNFWGNQNNFNIHTFNLFSTTCWQFFYVKDNLEFRLIDPSSLHNHWPLPLHSLILAVFSTKHLFKCLTQQLCLRRNLLLVAQDMRSINAPETLTLSKWRLFSQCNTSTSLLFLVRGPRLKHWLYFIYFRWILTFRDTAGLW